jgi:hypothetical protein
MPAVRASAAARRFAIWPILEVISELTENGGDCTFTTIESRVSESMQGLLSGALFADSSEEIFSLEQAASYVRVLNLEDQKLQVESLRARLKEAERNGNTSEAFRLIEDLNRLQRSRKA